MDTAHEWSQEVGMVKVAMEETAPSSCSKPSMLVEKKVRPQKDQATNCPRCNSTNTKFCYYNNYSLTQPRYFCKTCRRYWTAGGSLRNVPVGGGSRKNKIRSSLSNPSTSSVSVSSSSSAANSSHKIPDLNPPPISFSSQNPKTHDQGQDLNLAFPPPVMQDYLSISQFVEMPKNINQNQHHHNSNNQHHFSSSSATTSSQSTLSAIDLLRSTGIASRGFSSFFSMPVPVPMPMPMPDSNALYNSSGFHLQELKPNISLNSVDGLGISRYGSLHHEENGGGGGGGGGARLMFPFGVVKQVSSTSTTDQVDQNKGQGNPTGYWNGMFGTGGSW